MTQSSGTVELSEGVHGRRAVLAGGGATCLALILAACGGETQTPTVTGTTAAAGPTSADAATPGETGADPTGGTSADVLAKVADVPEGGGTVVGQVMLVKLAGGTIKAYDVRCTHMRSPVSPPVDGQLVCAAHNSAFKAEDGSVVRGPATVALRAIDVKVDGDNIVRA